MRFGWPSYVQNLIFLALQIMVVHKEFFQLLHELLAQLLDVANVCIAVVGFLDRNDPVIAIAFSSYPQ